ncbi:MAG: phosphonate ABC transporter substrate-binding protein [Hoeflea sp.]|uniref:phosphonate ABC transporter substrate-binding protein n=1 Tax=Hoeflea sp. TaxID=1940281 RepID=UPI001DE684F7|nr:phosphonate ABC transporter substrate-binding protein [Hoeflea sp.]MBU4528776.1 phosphonate ABC transporter substrate-binding protein [Alphaproteobacteria bacterium]MBU4545897.1 phosphonate ABC transporter substrate-binding protein [Alphaproteobacteria bacterium]MBU4549910.1 phosphonate ABC transporter substrate-binding protein [Alphaproteobacteria bacterium]MBV1725907.1 phosphonate ABC transporter substrate-binding protein [Hoeflea sp.]MBV1762632.1 phosphonate ABC transporter substrate-bin
MLKTILVAATAALLSTSAIAQDAITEFRIGVLGGENAQDRMTSNECVRNYVQELLGVETKLFTPADYDGVIQGLLGGTIDMAWLGASAYAKAYLTDPEAVDVVLVKTNVDGSVGYHSIGFARKDKNITSLADMKGKVFAFGDPNSTSGYLIPSVEIPAEIGATMNNGDYFSEVKFVGGHEQTIVAVNNGEVDAGVTWADGQGNWEDGYNSGALRKAVDSGIIDMNDLVEIWKSKEIPEGPIVLRRALPDDVKQKVVTFLSELHGKDPQCAYNMAAGETSGFTPITHDAYESIIAVRKAQSN